MNGNGTRKIAAALVSAAALLAAVMVRETPTTAAPIDGWQPVSHWVFSPAALSGKKIAAAVGEWPAVLTGTAEVKDGPPVAAAHLTGAPGDGITIREVVSTGDPVLPKEVFSVVTWVRVDEPTEWGSIFGCLQDNGNKERGFLLGFNKTRFYFGLASKGADDGDGKMTYLSGQTDYTPGRWYHVAAVYTGKQMKLFVNGQLDGTSDEQTGPVDYAASAPLTIGRYKDADEDYPLKGAVHEVAWCGTALTADAVAAHYKANEKLAQHPASDAGAAFVVSPYLQFGTRTSMTVMCETATDTDCVVEYGPALPMAFTAKSTAPATLHELPLTNLAPNTKYFYRVVCSDAQGRKVESRVLTFLTAVGPDDAYSFAVVGDTQGNPTVTGRIARLMWERRPNLVLHMGDVVDNGPIIRQWTGELFRPCQDLFGRVCVYPCIGNHERNHEHYYRYFSLPKPEYYYSFTYGNAEFFVLDTNKPVGPGTEQYKWLDAALARSTATWKMCYHHHPCYSSDDNDYGDTWKGSSVLGDRNARQLVPLYEKYGVDIALNGHVHAYERTWPIRGKEVDPDKGVVYLTTGGGGGKLEEVQPTPAFFKNQGRIDYHFCYFTVHRGQLECKVFDVEGRLFDSFALRKNR